MDRRRLAVTAGSLALTVGIGAGTALAANRTVMISGLTFNSAGTFDYICTIHPTMQGTVIVRATGGGGTAPNTDMAPTGRVDDGARSHRSSRSSGW